MGIWLSRDRKACQAVLRPGHRLTSPERAALSEAFDEALLNFKVDLVEMDLADEAFRQRIAKDLVLLQGAG
jgi:hypothetical protein